MHSGISNPYHQPECCFSRNSLFVDIPLVYKLGVWDYAADGLIDPARRGYSLSLRIAIVIAAHKTHPHDCFLSKL
jgi:hypothetical protein